MHNCSPLLTLLSLSRQMRNSASTCCTNTSKADDGKKKTLSEANYKLRKAKSLVNHSQFIINAIWLWPPCLNHREIINGDKSLETVHPAGIMHYGTAFAQQEANYADDGVWEKGGGEGEIEDTTASNIQASVELLYNYLRSGFALYNTPHLDCVEVTMRSHLFFQMFLSSSSRPHRLPHDQTQTHPTWTSHSITDQLVIAEAAESLLHLSQWNAGIRPKPARTPVPRVSVEALRAFQRSHRSVPSKFSQFLLFLWPEYDVTPQQQETPSGQTVGSKSLPLQESDCVQFDPVWKTGNVFGLAPKCWD